MNEHHSGAVRFAEMISKIAHELRSPLTSLKGFSATLLRRWDRFDDDQRRQLIETIHADAERMGRIVSEVLDLARLEAGRLELHPVVTDVAELCRRAVDELGEAAGGRIDVSVEDGLKAWADPERIGHVLANLLENAIKFSDEVPVTLAASATDEGVVISVADKGVGIAPDRLEAIFSGPAPPGQASSPTGSSLGLYLTRRLVEAHGGTIGATSDEGVGSTFTVILPAIPAHLGNGS